MCSTPDAPEAPPVLAAAATAPDVNSSRSGVSADERRRRRAAGSTGNVYAGAFTGSANQAQTNQKVLLGT